MALSLLSSRTISHSDVRPLTRRQIAAIAASAAAVSGVIAFVAGASLGKYFSDSELVRMATINARDMAEGRYAVERMGELTGKLTRLEKEAFTLGQKISALEMFKAMKGEGAAKAVALPKSTDAVQVMPAIAGAGGPTMAPRDCAAAPAGDDKTLSGDFVRFGARMDCLLDTFATLQRVTASRSLSYMMFPARAPIPGAAAGSPFGNRLDPINGGRAFHSGMDFSAEYGTPIKAAGGGKVVFAGMRSEMGYMVEVTHGDGLVTRYGHASKLMVRTGDIVTPGQVIAAVGSTGRSTGPHLHFEVLRNGQYVNPVQFLSIALGEGNG